MSRFYSREWLSPRVLAVALVEEHPDGTREWAAYCDAVGDMPTEDARREAARAVGEYGTKMKETWARAVFPQIDAEYRQ